MPGQQQIAVDRLQELRPPLRRIGPRDQVQHRMHVVAPLGVLQDQRQRRRRLGDQLAPRETRSDCPETRSASATPHRAGSRPPGPTPAPGDHRPVAEAFCSGTAAGRRRPQKIEHHLARSSVVAANRHAAPRRRRAGACLVSSPAAILSWQSPGRVAARSPRASERCGRADLPAGSIISSVSAQTSASTRSGCPVPDSPAPSSGTSAPPARPGPRRCAHPPLLVQRRHRLGPQPPCPASHAPPRIRHQRIDLPDHRLHQIAALVHLGHQPVRAVPVQRRQRRPRPALRRGRPDTAASSSTTARQSCGGAVASSRPPPRSRIRPTRHAPSPAGPPPPRSGSAPAPRPPAPPPASRGVHSAPSASSTSTPSSSCRPSRVPP